MPNIYQSAVADMSDEELRRLSDELQEAHECSSAYAEDDWPDSYWDDDAAESRYFEMQREIHRRFMLVHPDWKPPKPSVYVQAMMECLANSIDITSRVNAEFSAPFANKIGDTITIKKPWRYLAEGDKLNALLR